MDYDKKKFVRTRRMGIALCAFIWAPDSAIQTFMSNNSSMDLVIKEILDYKEILATSYDRKLFILGLINLMSQNQLIDAVKIRIHTLMSDIAEVLEKQSTWEKDELVKIK